MRQFAAVAALATISLMVLALMGCRQPLAAADDGISPAPPQIHLAALQQDATPDAPDFPAGLEWLNTDRPLSLKELRGKVVLLDFWTYG